jgi:hypothetical protein
MKRKLVYVGDGHTKAREANLPPLMEGLSRPLFQHSQFDLVDGIKFPMHNWYVRLMAQSFKVR